MFRLHCPRRPVALTLVLLATCFARPDVALAVDPPTELKVTVIDQATKSPIAGASIRATIDRGKDNLTTDEHGVAVIPLLDEQPRYVSLDVSKEGFSPITCTWGGYQRTMVLPPEATIPLPAAEAVGGRVLDADGKPVPGATVYLSFKIAGEDSGQLRSGISYQQVTADADGRWTFATAPAGWTSVSFGAFHLQLGGNREGYYGLAQIEDASSKEAFRGQQHEFRLQPKRTLKGLVVDNAGKPLQGIEVALGDDRIASNSLPPAKTDADGRYELGVIPDADVTLTFKEIHYAPELVRVKNTTDLGEVNMKLGPANKLRGRVVDSAGQPIAHAGVAVTGWRGSRTLTGQVETDEEGYFQFKAAPADAMLVDFYATGYADQREVSLIAGKEQTITLASPVNFTGKVIDADTKQPIVKFRPVVGILFGGDRAPYFQRQSGGDGETRANDDGSFVQTFTYPYPGRVIRVEADGYAPVDSPKFTMAGGDQTFTFELHHAAGITGTLQSADGAPVAGAEVYLVTAGGQLQVQNGRVPEYASRELVSAKSDAAGKFTLPPEPADFLLYITGDAGTATIARDALAADPVIKLAPWATVSGSVFIGSKPAAGMEVKGWSQREFHQDKPSISMYVSATADAAGKYTLDRVAPEAWHIGRHLDLGDNSSTTTNAQAIAPKPGEHVELTIGNRGRPVVGHIDVPPELRAKPNWTVQFFSLQTKRVQGTPPKSRDEMRAMSKDDLKAYLESPEMKAFQEKERAEESQRKHFTARVSADGTFRFDDVDPGTYELSGRVMERATDPQRAMGEVIGTIATPDIVIAEGNVDDPVEVSSVTVTIRHTVAIGQPAPDFDVPTLDGKTVKLSSLRGKVVLLDFWATWCGPCVAEVPNMKAAYEQLKGDDHFAMISLSLDPKMDEPKAFTEKNGMTWTQGFLGEWSASKVPASYGVEGIPEVMLIDADGTVIAKGLRGEAIATAAAKALAQPR